ATRFLAQGKIPVMMFGLPAAALAMYKTAKPENRQRIKGILTAGALASLVTGITEPLEFSFLFVAPILYLVHSVLAGLSFMLNHLFGVAIGNTQGGVIDLLVFGDRKSTRLNSSHVSISYAVFCLKKKILTCITCHFL